MRLICHLLHWHICMKILSLRTREGSITTSALHAETVTPKSLQHFTNLRVIDGSTSLWMTFYERIVFFVAMPDRDEPLCRKNMFIKFDHPTFESARFQCFPLKVKTQKSSRTHQQIAEVREIMAESCKKGQHKSYRNLSWIAKALRDFQLIPVFLGPWWYDPSYSVANRLMDGGDCGQAKGRMPRKARVWSHGVCLTKWFSHDLSHVHILTTVTGLW